MHQTLGPILTAGLKAYSDRSAASQKTTRCAVANLVRLVGTVRTSRLTSSTIDRYRQSREREGCSAATRNREVGVLRAILRRAVDRGAKIRLPFRWGQETEKVRQRVLTLAEFRRLSEQLAADLWVADVVQVLLATGARVGELLAATPADVSFSADRSQATIVIEQSKEGGGKVLVATNGAVKALERLWLTAQELKAPRLCARPQVGQDQFSAGSADYQRLRWHLSRACRRAQLDKPVNLHDLRRTFGSWALQGGATLEQVGQSLGHKSVQTTRRAYARIDEATRARVGDLVTSQLGGE